MRYSCFPLARWKPQGQSSSEAPCAVTHSPSSLSLTLFMFMQWIHKNHKKLLTFTPCSVQTSRVRVLGGASPSLLQRSLSNRGVFLFSLWDSPSKTTCVSIFKAFRGQRQRDITAGLATTKWGLWKEEVLKWMCQRDSFKISCHTIVFYLIFL